MTDQASGLRHTPGPWKWMKYPDGRKMLLSRDLAVIHCPDAPMTVDEADARLIASAPDLLAALTRILAAFDAGVFCRSTDNDGDSAWAIKCFPHLKALADATVAIQKAEGR